MPAYNCKKYIREAVESVLGQPYQRIRLILIDDGSTDGTSLICDDLAACNERIFVIHQENKGVSAARNTGINQAFSWVEKSGKNCYLAFLDADDKWVDGFFDGRIVDLLGRGYDLLGFQSCRCNETITRREKTVTMAEGEHDGGVASIWIHTGQHFGAMLYRMEFLKKYNISFYDIKYSEDKIFIMQCLYLTDKVYMENKLMHLYRQTKSSAVHIRNFGIRHFPPIIDAYLKSDEEMRQWSDRKGEVLNEGKQLAGIYVMDMIDEHYQLGGSKEELDALFKKNPSYKNLVSGNSVVSKRWKQMQEHLWIYRAKNRIYGILFNAMRRIYHTSFAKNVIDEKRYSVKI